MHDAIRSNAVWQGSSRDEIDAAMEALERFLTSKIYDAYAKTTNK